MFKSSIHQCVSAVLCRCKPSQELMPTPFQQQLANSSSSTCQVSHHFQLIYWRCDFNPLLNHLTIKSLPYWSAKGLLLLQKVVWFWSFFGKNWYTFNSITPGLETEGASNHHLEAITLTWPMDAPVLLRRMRTWPLALSQALVDTLGAAQEWVSMSSQTSETSVDKQEEDQEPLKMRVVTPILNPVSKRMVDLTLEPRTLGIMVLLA